VTSYSELRHRQTDSEQPPATRFVLGTDEGAADGLRRVLMEQVDLATYHASHVPESDQHVHEVRKATKRVRAVLRMVRDEIDTDMYRDVNTAVRDISRLLSRARSAVAMVDIFEGLINSDPSLTSAGAEMHDGLNRERRRMRLGAGESLVEELVRRLAGVRARLGEAEMSGGEGISTRWVRRTYGRGRNGMTRAFADRSPESFHIWRKQVKYLRHQMELLVDIGSDDVAQFIKDLESLGEDLGRGNDLADLEHWIATFESPMNVPGGSDAFHDAILRTRIHLEMTLLEPADRLFQRRPSLFEYEMLPVMA
jgi:CHAD domain-containing protein